MKGCGRLDPFSVITYHLGLFFSPFSLAASSKRMGTLEGVASSELNIDKSWCVILVLICDATQGQLVGWLAPTDCSTRAGLHFLSIPPTQIHFFLKRCQLSCLFLNHSVKAVLVTHCSFSSPCFVVSPVFTAYTLLCQSEWTTLKLVYGCIEGLCAGQALNYDSCRVMNL